MNILRTILIAALLTPSFSALAEEAKDNASAWTPPEHRLVYQNLTVLRVNPLGLQNKFDLAYRYRLMESDSLLFRDTFVGVAFQPLLTPAFADVGVAAQLQPLTALFLEARWQWRGWLGTFNHLQSFDSPEAEYSDSAIKAGGENEQHYSTTGWLLGLTAELRAKVGPVVVRNRFQALYSDMDLRNDDPLYYEPLTDLLAPNKGWLITNDSDLLLFLLDEHLIVGARYSLGHGLDVGGPSANGPTHRVGPLIAYIFEKDPGATFNKPTLLLLTQWYLGHRFRTGQDVSQAIPYIALGFAFSGDLL